MMPQCYRILTAQAPVNLAVIKYWGKSHETLKIPINDSISGTLNIEHMCATTTVAISDTFSSDEMWLNGIKQNIDGESPVKTILAVFRSKSNFGEGSKVHILSHNNFPTAAGLASSAAGYACLAFVLGHLYGITDLTELSMLARQGSGSACRSLFGGFVLWQKEADGDLSRSCAVQLIDHKYWPQMRVIICVVSASEKDVSSSIGMKTSVETSSLIDHRAKSIVPARINQMKTALVERDFQKFAEITMKDSNQFHAICLDTYPPLFYLNEASRQIIKICTKINQHFGRNVVAYTFDAGPNACIYLLEEHVDLMLSILRDFFPSENGQPIEVKGDQYKEPESSLSDTLGKVLRETGVQQIKNAIAYLINTSIGEGPRLIDQHISDVNLKST